MTVRIAAHLKWDESSQVEMAMDKVGEDASTGVFEGHKRTIRLADATTETVYDDSVDQIGTLSYLFLWSDKQVTVEFKGSAADELMGFVVKAGFPFILSGQMLPEGIAGGAEAIKVIKVNNASGATAEVHVGLIGT